MGNCKDCRHWTPHPEQELHEKHGACDKLGTYVAEPEAPLFAVYVGGYDDGNHRADIIYTLPDFGCVLFEEKT